MAYIDKYGVKFSDDGTILIKCPKDFSGEYLIPDSVRCISKCAFYNCRELTGVTLTNNIFSIGDDAFNSCRLLSSITLPRNIKKIGERAFYNCSSMAEINVVEENKKFCSVDGVLFNKKMTKIIAYPKGKQGQSPRNHIGVYHIPEGVLCIGDYAFARCSVLTRVRFPHSIKQIGECGFWGCNGLKRISLTDDIDSIGARAFSGCSSLKGIIVPEGQKERFVQMGSLKNFAGIIAESDEEINSLLNSQRRRKRKWRVKKVK